MCVFYIITTKEFLDEFQDKVLIEPNEIPIKSLLDVPLGWVPERPLDQGPNIENLNFDG